jgi:hypothetical protein
MDGSARVHGVIRQHDDGRWRLLVAARDGAQTECADADADGATGLTRIAATFRAVKSDQRIPVLLVPTMQDIDATGVYTVMVQVGDNAVTGEVFVRLPSGRSPDLR